MRMRTTLQLKELTTPTYTCLNTEMAVHWYPLPEVSPAEERWWERESSTTISDVRKDSLNLSSLSESSLRATPAPTSTGSEGRRLELSISSLHTATPTLDASSISTPSRPSRSSLSTLSRARKGVGEQRVKFVPELEALTELDELWRRFQSSSMVGKENRGVVKCTCCCERNKLLNERRLVARERKDLTSGASSTKTHHLPKRSVLVERAVQTSPSPIVTHPPQTCHVTRSPSVAFTIPISRQPARPKHETTSHRTMASSSRPATTRERPGGLTLSEAFALSHPEFIEASLRRQREIRQRQELVDLQNLLTRQMNEPRRPHPSFTSPRFTSHPPSSAAYAGSGQSHRVKMTKREMYDASKRVWSQLPEVKAKQVAEKRKSEAVTNRIRMKAYQQEVLLRLRRLNKKKH